MHQPLDSHSTMLKYNSMTTSHDRRMLVNTLFFWTVTGLACSSQAVLVAIIIWLATKDLAPHTSVYYIAIAASITDILALISLPATVFLYLRRTAHRLKLYLCTLAILLTILAALLTIYTLVQAWRYPIPFSRSNHRSDLALGLTEGGFVVWTVAIVAQIALCTIAYRQQGDHDATLPAEELSERPSPTTSVKHSISMHFRSLTPPQPPAFLRSMSEPTSPAFSTNSSSPKSSIKDSVNHIVKPMSSKTRLICGHSNKSKDSHVFRSRRETSQDTFRQDDGFEEWNTGAVEDYNEENYVHRSSRGRLPTIPGSRPVSPANKLEGPFPDYDTGEDILLPESPLHSPMASPSSETSSIRLSRATVRHPNAFDQSHIHPLFRSESPGPPPIASPGTVISASPYAGSIVSPDHQVLGPWRLHSPQSNRAESPSPSPLSPNRSRQDSLRSLRMPASSPIELSASGTVPTIGTFSMGQTERDFHAP